MLKVECKRDGLDDDSDDDDVRTVKSSKRKRAIESDSEEESDDESDESDEENDDGDGDEKDHSDAPDSDEEEGSDEEDNEDEDEESEETDSEADDTDDETQPTTTQRKRRIANIESGSESDDSEADDTDDEIQPTTTQRKRRIANIESGSESDDSTAMESSGDPCPICLGHMKGDIGSPETCDHSFCLECILEWSKKNNSCPQDRKTFVLVFVRHQIGGPVVRRVPVAESKPDDIPDEVEEDQTFCEVCRRRDREDRLLLCDGCDLGYHMECLAPPLEQVPINEWFCPDCQAVNSTVSSAEVEIEDPTLRPTRNSNQAVEQPRRVRILPRTSASERVRAVISRSRNAVIKRSRKERARPTATQEQERHYESAIDAVAVVGGSISLSWQPLSSKSKPRRSTKAPKRKKRKVTRKRKIKRKKVAPKKRKVSKAGKSRGSKKRKTGKTTRPKRKIKRKRKVSKKVKIPKPAMTPKSRIAEVLGIHPCKPWQLTPTMQPPNSKEQFSGRRDNAALPNLSLLGVNAEVGISMEADEYGDAILAAGVRSSSVTSSQAFARRKALSVRAQMSHTSIRIRVAHKPRPIENTPSALPPDLLGSILENQTRLMNTEFSSNSKNSFPFKSPFNKSIVKLGNIPIQLNEKVEARSRAAGPDSPSRQQSGGDGQSSLTSTQQQQEQQQQSASNSTQEGREGSQGGVGSEGERGQSTDPTGSKAFASLYLRKKDDGREASRPENELPTGSCNGSEKDKKYNEKKKKNDDDEVDLYSDIEPSVPEGDDDDDDDDDDEGDDDNGNYAGNIPVPLTTSEADKRENERDPESSGDELVIDDSDKPQVKESLADVPLPPLPLPPLPPLFPPPPPPRLLQMVGEPPEDDNVVGSSNLPGLNDFELEAVSDTDTPELEKSANSSISLSDVGDHEVTSSTNENPNPAKSEHLVTEIFGESDEEKNREKNNQPIVGLEGLETETISDNEEISFDDNDDNIEEGEIPNEIPRHATPLSNRPRVNLEIRRVIEVAPHSPRDQEVEYEEVEIIDENAKRKEKKKEKNNKKLEDKEQDGEEEEEEEEEANEEEKEVEESEKDKENKVPKEVQPEPEKELEATVVIPIVIPHETPKSPPPKKTKSKQREKEKEKEKEKDVSFKKVSKSTKERNYREMEKEDRDKDKKGGKNIRDRNRNRQDIGRERRDRDRGDKNDRNKDSNRRRDRDRDKRREPKRKEMERYNVRKMITQKEEERKKKDEFGRDVALRSRSRSRSRRRSRSRSQRRSKSRSRRRSGSRPRKGRRSYSRSASRSRNKKRGARRRSYSSSSSSSYTSSSSSSSSSSRSRSRGPNRVNRRRRTRSRSRTPLKKKPEKKKVAAAAAAPPSAAVAAPAPAPAKSKEKTKEKSKKANPVIEKKKEKKKDDKRKGREIDKREEARLERERRRKRREKSPLQSKEVYQAGGSIMVSVSFAKRAPGKENKDAKRRKERDVKMEGFKKARKPANKPHGSPLRSWSRSRTPSGKRTPLQDEPMWSPDHLTEPRIAEKPLKSPEVIDLDVIMVTPPPQEPILISDSEDEGITRLPPDLGTTPVPPVRPQGPKTPPEPAVKFTLSSKQVLKPITNPLRDAEEEEEEEEPPAPARGPNTPPGPPPESDESVGRAKSPSGRVPRSPAGSPPGSSPEPDVYDPFEPTKSPSPPGSPQQEARVSSSDQTETVEKSSPEVVAPKAASPPPLPTEPPEPEERPPEPQKPPEEEATSTVPPAAPPPISVAVTTTTSTKASKASKTVSSSSKVTPPKIVVPNTAPPVVATPVNPITQIFPGLPANVANILYPAALAAAVRNANNAGVRPQVVQTVVAPDFSRPPPAANLLTRPPPMTIIAPTRIGEKTRISQNGRDVTHTDVIDMDLDSPNSPDSSDVSDIFEPPSPHSTHQSEKPSPKKIRNQTKSTPVKAAKGGVVDKFDNLFGNAARAARKHGTPHKHKHGKKGKIPGKKEGNEEDIPNSAVDLQVKEKMYSRQFLKKVQRQERVVEEVKLSLKPFYNKKTIGKDDYKDIMRKCVQKVCHNRSGEINPTKIRGLVQGYIKKVKYYRKKMNGPADQVPGKPTATEPPPPSFPMFTKMKPPTPIKSKA